MVSAHRYINNKSKISSASDLVKKLSFLLEKILKFLKSIDRKKALLILIALVVVISSGIVIYNKFIKKEGSGLITSKDDGFEKLVIPERERPFFELKTEETRKFGILPQDNFILKTQEPVSLEFINSVLSTSNNFKVEEINEQEFRIQNTSLLGLDQPLTVSLDTEGKQVGGYTFSRDYNWAFQSQGKFKVVSTIPGNEKTKVPLNTGIEIVFSQDNFADPKRYFEISPKIDFETKVVDETLAIVPQSELLAETVYTVTLKKGLRLNSRNDQIDEDYVFSFQTREASAPKQVRPWLSIRDTFIQTSPTEPFITKINKNDWSDDMKAKVVVYRFNGSSDFIATRQEYDSIYTNWRDYYPEKHHYSEGLAEVYREDVSVQQQDKIDYLQFSQTMDPGYYLVEFYLGDSLVSDQVWYQSTELTGYLSLGKEQTIVWANNFASGKPSSSTLVRSITSGGTWYTNDDGVAKFPTPRSSFDENPHYFELTDPAGNSLVIPVPSQKGNAGPGDKTTYDYWSYIYTEKYFYSSDDTVNYWGVLKDRNTGAVVSNAQLVLISPTGEEVFKRNIVISSDGSFIGNLPLQSAPDGWYWLKVRVGEEEVANVNFSVRQYIKPDMKIEITSDKKAIFTDEEVKFKVKSSFFDETPGANFELNIHENRSSKITELKTDDNGAVEYTYKPTYRERYYYPTYEGISALPALTQESIVQGYGSVQVFGPKLIVDVERDQTETKASLEAIVYKIDLTGINAGTTNDPKGDVVSDQEIKINVVENWTERIPDGTFYNFIEKITYPKYRYERNSDEVINKTVKTDSAGKMYFDFGMKDTRSYELTLETEDNEGHKITQTHYFYSSKWNTYYQAGEDSNIYLDIAFGRDTNIYSLGDKVNLKLVQQGDDYKDSENDSFLFTTAQRGYQDVIVTDVPFYSFTFGNANIPNTFISAIVFSGGRYKKALATCRREWLCGEYYYGYSYDYNSFKGIQIAYDEQDSKLNIEIKYSKEAYAPGETASVEAVVTKSGNPVVGASVNLVMVDAALAAIGGVREPSVLGNLYSKVPHQVYYVYTSHEPILPEVPSAEKGGGGGDRELFKDTAVFLQSQSDDSGIAHFDFVLPDNITTWLTYSQAVTANLDAGMGEASVVVTKDFFVTSKFPKSILEADKTSISVNSFGTSLQEGDDVDYQVLYAQDGKTIDEQTVQGGAFEEKDFEFPQLASGVYDVTVRGEADGRSDGIKLPMEVITSRLKQGYSIKHTVNEGEGITELIPDDYLKDEPIVLIVSDKGKGIFFGTLTRYCWGSRSNRLERKISSIRADSLLENEFDYDKCFIRNTNLADFQNEDGGLAQVVWGGSNLKTSLWAFIVSSDDFDEDKLVSYFEEQYENSQGGRLTKIQAGWALSLLGESKLRELKGMSDSVTSLDEKVHLALALSYLGDTEVARDMYLDILADYGYTRTPYIRVDANQDRGNTIENFVVDTSNVLLLGEVVDKKYNDGLYSYINDYRGDLENYIIDLSEMAYIEKEIDALPDSDTKYRLTTSTGTSGETLNRGKSETYELTSDDVDIFDFDLSSGKAELSASYFIGIDVLNNKPTDKRLSIKRGYSKAKGEGDIHPGDLVRVDLELTMDLDSSPKGTYEVKDILPSGLTYISNPSSFGLAGAYYVYDVTNNVAKFNVYNSKYQFPDGKKKITYYTRASAVGDFKAEPAVFQSQKDLTVLTKTGEDEIVIK